MKYIDLVRGTYPTSTTERAAEVLVGNSFGAATGDTSVNRRLATYIEAHAQGRPIVADTMLAQLIEVGDVHEVKGDVTNALGAGLDSWGVELAARQFMSENGLNVAEQVAHRYHLARAGVQAVQAGILLNVFPDKDDMPNWFDVNSEQIWTRSRGQWMLRESVGVLALKMRGQLQGIGLVDQSLLAHPAINRPGAHGEYEVVVVQVSLDMIPKISIHVSDVYRRGVQIFSQLSGREQF